MFCSVVAQCGDFVHFLSCSRRFPAAFFTLCFSDVAMATEKPELFKPLDAAVDEQDTATEITSLCMNCHKDGVTRLLLTRIPHYREVVLMSFSCEDCGFTNNEIQPGGPIADMGVRFTLTVSEPTDLNRQIVKSDYSSLRIPHIDFEIPAKSQKGEITTVEGVISRALEGLVREQPARREIAPKEAALIDNFVDKLHLLTDPNYIKAHPFTIELEDISGNSWIENPVAPSDDPRCRCTRFTRSTEQDHKLGIFSHSEVEAAIGEPVTQNDSHLLSAPGGAAGEGQTEGSFDQLLRDEVLRFRTDCPSCGAPADTNMKLTSIPHFKDVVIMATTCDACGHRTNEVKSGGGIEERGVRISVRVASPDDFSRDVLKSETCSMLIPELDLEVGSAALGGRFTTTEGLLRATLVQLRDGPCLGDSAVPERRQRMERFLLQLEEVLSGKRRVTLVLDDPAGNSYVQSLVDDGLDEGLTVERYDRSYDQNEELGLNDMKTEEYEQDA